MKRMFWITGFILSVMIVQAQSNSWSVRVNNKVLLASSSEDEKRNTRKLSAAEWKKAGTIEIRFTDSEPGQWKRSFLFFDENDEQLLAKNNTYNPKIKLASLRKLYKGKKEIRIYTTIAPVDPNIAIRVRRVHLITIYIPG